LNTTELFLDYNSQLIKRLIIDNIKVIVAYKKLFLSEVSQKLCQKPHKILIKRDTRNTRNVLLHLNTLSMAAWMIHHNWSVSIKLIKKVKAEIY
jgi:hypothetical protein